MPARLFEKNVGDTIITPTCLIVVDSIRVVQDSVIMNRLGPEYVAYAPLLKVRDLYDPTLVQVPVMRIASTSLSAARASTFPR
ncbi:MAG: hypothetical protein IPP33_18095 [Flavobacteriales bacterium]|nr:hypothetical protein [Flavobacteriales bacterium]